MQMSTAWSDYRKANNISDEDPRLEEKMIAFFNTFQFSTKLKGLRNELTDYYMEIDEIRQRSYPNDSSRTLSKLYQYAFSQENKVVRPIEPFLEVEKKYDEIELSKLWIYGNIGGTFDEGQSILPSGSLPNFLELLGKRAVDISKGHVVDASHERTWSTKVSGRKWGLFKVSGSATSREKWVQSVNKIGKFSMSFENMAEYWVNRGRWYDSTVFDFDEVKRILKARPTLEKDLTYVISSVIIGRGLSLTLHFSDTQGFETWNDLDISAGGGFSFFGLGAQASGTYSNHDWSKTVDTAAKTVTFTDSPAHCRLLGFRVENLLPVDENLRATEFHDWADIFSLELNQMSSGKLSYTEFERGAVRNKRL